MEEATQLDRIERKLDEFLAFRDALLAAFLPKVPEKMRPKVAELLANRQGARL
jgi:hypothetical protein